MQLRWQRGTTNSLSVTHLKAGKKILLSREGNALTIEQARKSGMIMEYLEKINKTELVATIAMMLTELLSTQLNDLTPSQVLDVAETIVYSCKGWTPDDILLVLRNGRDGKYSGDNLTARWTMQTFNNWANAYEVERSNVEVNKHLNTKENTTTSEDTKHMIYKDRIKSAPVNVKAPPSIGGVIADENYFNPKK